MIKDALKAIQPPFDFGTAMIYLQEGCNVKRLEWERPDFSPWLQMLEDDKRRQILVMCVIGKLGKITEQQAVIPVADITAHDWVLVP